METSGTLREINHNYLGLVLKGSDLVLLTKMKPLFQPH